LLRINDRVYHWSNISRSGTVVKVALAKNNKWIVGGVASKSYIIEVKYDDGIIEKTPSNDLRLLERP